MQDEDGRDIVTVVLEMFDKLTRIYDNPEYNGFFNRDP